MENPRPKGKTTQPQEDVILVNTSDLAAVIDKLDNIIELLSTSNPQPTPTPTPITAARRVKQYEVDDEEESMYAKKQRPAKSGTGRNIAAVIIGIIAIVGVLIAVYLSSQGYSCALMPH